MNKRYYLLPVLLVISACSGISDTRPELIRKSEYFLEHGVSAYEEGDYVAATDFLRKALAHYRSIDNIRGILLSHINLAETALAAGNFSAAEEHIDSAEQVGRNSEQEAIHSRLALMRAQLFWRRHDSAKALAQLQPLLPEFDEEQHSRREPDLLALGAVSLRTDIAFERSDDEYQEARLWLRRLSLMLPLTEGDTGLYEARRLRFEGQLAYHEGDSEEALEKLEQSLQFYREAANRPAIAATLTEIAQLLMKLQRWQEAEAHLQRAFYIRLWIMDRAGSAELLQMLQEVYLALGDEAAFTQAQEELGRIALPHDSPPAP